jgi:hypothetical protein
MPVYDGLMRPRTVPLSPFGALLTELCGRNDSTPYEVGLRIGITSRSMLSYATRPHQGGGKRGLLTIKQIRALARAARATPDEEFRLVILGCLEHTPRVLADYVADLEQENAELRKKTGSPIIRRRLLDA